MISILVPIYNCSVVELVNGLTKQIAESSIVAEVIVVDDASTQFIEENNTLENLEAIGFERLTKNRGRSAIRNYLASKAKYNYLLFIDCDAQIINPNFLDNYAKAISDKTEVICGGVAYQENKPDINSLYFRWYYGKNRECRSLEDRTQNPYKSFLSFNFLIKKEIFEEIKFEEQLTMYGHEDTLLGIELKKRKTDLLHINNSLIHDGLESVDVFLHKTRQSVESLKNLQSFYSNKDLLEKSIKLLKYISRVQKLKLSWFFRICYNLLKQPMLTNLKSKKPSLRVFDLYKIFYFFSIK